MNVFRFAHNGHGYDVVWRDSARLLGTVRMGEAGWFAVTPDGQELPRHDPPHR